MISIIDRSNCIWRHGFFMIFLCSPLYECRARDVSLGGFMNDTSLETWEIFQNIVGEFTKSNCIVFYPALWMIYTTVGLFIHIYAVPIVQMLLKTTIIGIFSRIETHVGRCRCFEDAAIRVINRCSYTRTRYGTERGDSVCGKSNR